MQLNSHANPVPGRQARLRSVSESTADSIRKCATAVSVDSGCDNSNTAVRNSKTTNCGEDGIESGKDSIGRHAVVPPVLMQSSWRVMPSEKVEHQIGSGSCPSRVLPTTASANNNNNNNNNNNSDSCTSESANIPQTVGDTWHDPASAAVTGTVIIDASDQFIDNSFVQTRDVTATAVSHTAQRYHHHHHSHHRRRGGDYDGGVDVTTAVGECTSPAVSEPLNISQHYSSISRPHRRREGDEYDNGDGGDDFYEDTLEDDDQGGHMYENGGSGGGGTLYCYNKETEGGAIPTSLPPHLQQHNRGAAAIQQHNKRTDDYGDVLPTEYCGNNTTRVYTAAAAVGLVGATTTTTAVGGSATVGYPEQRSTAGVASAAADQSSSGLTTKDSPGPGRTKTSIMNRRLQVGRIRVRAELNPYTLPIEALTHEPPLTDIRHDDTRFVYLNTPLTTKEQRAVASLKLHFMSLGYINADPDEVASAASMSTSTITTSSNLGKRMRAQRRMQANAPRMNDILISGRRENDRQSSNDHPFMITSSSSCSSPTPAHGTPTDQLGWQHNSGPPHQSSQQQNTHAPSTATTTTTTATITTATATTATAATATTTTAATATATTATAATATTTTATAAGGPPGGQFQRSSADTHALHSQRQQASSARRGSHQWVAVQSAQYLRFLYSAKFDVSEATDMLWSNYLFRRRDLPIDEAAVSEDLKLGAAYWHGRDRGLRPLLVIKLSRLESLSTELDRVERVLVFCFEFFLRYLSVPGRVENWFILVDCEGCGVTNFPTPTVKSVLHTLNTKYRGRLYRLIVVNFPKWVGWLSGWIMSLVPSSSTHKLTFMPSGFEPFLLQYFAPHQLERKYGGAAVNISHEFYPFKFFPGPFGSSSVQHETPSQEAVPNLHKMLPLEFFAGDSWSLPLSWMSRNENSPHVDERNLDIRWIQGLQRAHLTQRSREWLRSSLGIESTPITKFGDLATESQ